MQKPTSKKTPPKTIINTLRNRPPLPQIIPLQSSLADNNLQDSCIFLYHMLL